MSKINYSELAKEILSNIGGPDNVSTVTHCMTRLRFVLKDASIPDDDRIKQLDGVIEVIRAGGQYQIVIGQTVPDLYDAVLKVSDKRLITAPTIDKNLDQDLIEPKQKLSVKVVTDKIIDALVGSIVPTLPILIGSGIIQAFLLVFSKLGWIAASSPTYVTLEFVANAAFYFLPVYVASFAAKRFNTSVPIGMLLGAILLHPTFTQLVAQGKSLGIFGLPIYPASYGSTIVPALLAVWIMSYVQKFIAKISPKSVRVILEPTLTIIIMTPLTLCLLAPLGQILSSGFVSGMMWIHKILGPVELALFSALAPFIIMFGLHVGTVPFSVDLIKHTGMDNAIAPAFFLSNFAQGAALLAVGTKTKNSQLRQVSFSSAFSVLIPGISEPGMYGVTLKYKTPMIAAVIGSACGGLYMGIMNVGASQFLPPNIFQLVVYMSSTATLINTIIAIFITMAVSFAVTMYLYKDKGEK